MSVPSNQVAVNGGPTISADNLNTYVQTVDTVADARNFVGVAGMSMSLQGNTAPGDGGQGDFYWNAGALNPLDDGGVTTIVPAGAAQGCWTRLNSVVFSGVAIGQCRLIYSSPTLLSLIPFMGNKVAFPSGQVAVLTAVVTAIPNACFINGVTGALGNSTLYYVYLWLNGNTPALDFSLTGHITDPASGIEIKTGDATRVLVGLILTSISGQFVFSPVNVQVISWFNRLTRAIAGNGPTINTTATSEAEISISLRVTYLTWNTGDDVLLSISGYVANTNVNATTTARILTDGGAGASGYDIATSATANAIVPLSAALSYSVAEGAHFATVSGFVSAGTTTWNVLIVGQIEG